MRLFFALTFDNATKSQITRYRDIVADLTVKGRFTKESNFHLTLAFIGNVGRAELNELIRILYMMNHYPAAVRAEYLGSFKRKGAELVWLGLEKSEPLMSVQKELSKNLTDAGFSLEKRKYLPHITLGRNLVLKEQLSGLIIDPCPLEVKSIALMESKTVNGELVYEPLEEITDLM